MALTAQQIAAGNRISATYNGNTYNSTTNPGGMAGGGHRTNFVPAIQDVVTFGQGVIADASASSSAALTSAGQAASSASSASGSAGAAAGALASTQSIYTTFHDRYLGTFGVAPSVGNDGGAILVGALYFNSTENKMKVRGSDNVWQNAYASLTGTISAPTSVTAGNILSFGSSDGLNAADSGVSAARVMYLSGGFSTLSANTTLNASNRGGVFYLNGSAQLQLPIAPPTGWFVWIKKNDGTGSWAVTSIGGPVIDGRNSINVYQEDFMVYYDGSVYRTLGRRRGWVPVSNVSTAQGGVGLYSDTTGFGDPELSMIELSYEGLVQNATSYPMLRVKKLGGIVSGNTYTYGMMLAGASQTSGANTFIPLLNTGSLTGNALNGRVLFRGINSTTFNGQAIEVVGSRAYDNGTALATGVAYEGQGAAIQGWQIQPSAGSWNGITYTVKGYRA